MKAPLSGAHAAARSNNAPHVAKPSGNQAAPASIEPAPTSALIRLVEARWFRTLVIVVIVVDAPTARRPVRRVRHREPMTTLVKRLFPMRKPSPKSKVSP